MILQLNDSMTLQLNEQNAALIDRINDSSNMILQLNEQNAALVDRIAFLETAGVAGPQG